MSWTLLGALHEEIGRVCSSVRSLLTVHAMTAFAIQRWGNNEQRERWLLPLACGEVLGALALSEPNAGSDITGIEATAVHVDGGFVVNGCKKWMTIGQIAGLFLVLLKGEGGSVTLLIERDRPGLTIDPIHDVLGTRGSMLATLKFRDCFVPRENLIARPGFGNSVALSALSLGRYSVACGSVGIIQACMDASLEYARKISRFGAELREHQLIQQMVADMVTDASASRLLCREAGRMRDEQDPAEIRQTFIAKYHAASAAMRAANSAVQIHGANGCSSEYPVQRYMRDAKVMEIIEGSTQIQQITIALLAFQELGQAKSAQETLSKKPV
ncbi:Acryloyl-CoA reductase (NADH) [Dyella sp. AD56]|nr:Acryloyl-CoA reductase (NADH) [Dyella sp. AD56]